MNTAAKNEYLRRWRNENKEKKSALDKAWRKANPERMIANKRAWRAKNLEKARESARKWARENPEQLSIAWHKRRARKLAALGVVSKDIVARLMLLQRSRCANCLTSVGASFHLDHIQPLSKGGAHDDANLQLLCPTCNFRKSAMDPIEWAQSEGRLL